MPVAVTLVWGIVASVGMFVCVYLTLRDMCTRDESVPTCEVTPTLEGTSPDVYLFDEIDTHVWVRTIDSNVRRDS